MFHKILYFLPSLVMLVAAYFTYKGGEESLALALFATALLLFVVMRVVEKRSRNSPRKP